jgi:hypothetical protein
MSAPAMPGALKKDGFPPSFFVYLGRARHTIIDWALMYDTMNLRILLSALPLSLAWGMGVCHADTLYKCTDPDGHATYTNSKGSAKNCVVLSRDQPVSSFSVPRAKPSAPTPGDFPKVAAGEQKARDGDRRAILDQELASEQKSLEEAKRTLAQQETTAAGKGSEQLKPYHDTVQLHERNIEALRKEIGNLK